MCPYLLTVFCPETKTFVKPVESLVDLMLVAAVLKVELNPLSSDFCFIEAALLAKKPQAPLSPADKFSDAVSSSDFY